MRFTAFVFALGLAFTPACDDSADEDGQGGPTTTCILNFKVPNDTLKGFGEGCDADAECEFSECLTPGTAGNLTNTLFGFCTRGCDCNNDASSQLPNELSEELDCLYPPQPNANLRHVVVECANVAECQALDSRWNDCKIASSGNARKVCHAL